MGTEDGNAHPEGHDPGAAGAWQRSLDISLRAGRGSHTQLLQGPGWEGKETPEQEEEALGRAACSRQLQPLSQVGSRPSWYVTKLTLQRSWKPRFFCRHFYFYKLATNSNLNITKQKHPVQAKQKVLCSRLGAQCEISVCSGGGAHKV